MENEKSRKLLKVCAVVCAAAGVLSLVIFIPQVRELIIGMGEKYVGRPLTHDVWHKRFIAVELTFLLTFILPAITFLGLDGYVQFSSEKIPLFERPFFDKKYLLAVALCFAFISGIRFYWMNQKDGFHVDELYGIDICNFNSLDKGGIGFWRGYPEKGRAYSGIEIKEKCFFNDSSVGDILKDEARLWLYNRDSPHPSLYYMLFRLWFVGAKTHDFHHIFIRGILLNYVFFCISFLLMLHLLKILSAGRVASIFLLLMAFCNPASVGISIFLRPYALQETGLILFSIVFVRYLKLLAGGRKEFDKAFWFKTTLVTAVTISTDYFPIMFVGLAGLIVLLNCGKNRDWNSLRYFLLMFVAAFLISRLFYFGYGFGLFIDRGETAVSKLNHGILQSLGSAFIITISEISANLINFYALLILLISNIILFIVSKKKNASAAVFGIYPLILFLVALLWAVATMFFAPFTTLRYMTPAFCLLPVILIPCAKSKPAVITALLLQIIAATFVCAKTLPLEQNAANIEHIDDSDKTATNLEYNQHLDIPVFIKYVTGIRTRLYPYLNDRQTYYFIDDEAELSQYQQSDYYYLDFLEGDGILIEKRHKAEGIE